MCFGVFGNGHNHQSITDQNKKRMTAIIKMFFIMGITWIAEIVSFSIDWHDPNNSDNPISFAFSIINALQVTNKNRFLKIDDNMILIDHYS